jgi:type I restriction enzyme S subunit
MNYESQNTSWKFERLERHCDKPQYGFTASATENNAGSKFLRITDIQDNGVNWESVPYCELGNTKKENYLLKRDDIVVARIGATTGKAFLIGECPEAVFASYLIRIRTKPTLLPEFLSFYFQSEQYWQHIDQNKGGRLKGGVNIPILQNLLVPLPPLSEQKAIAKILQTIQQAKEARQRELDLERERKAALMQHLFTHGTRGEKTKQTEIGEMPESWELHTFVEMVKIAQGQVDPKIEPYKSMTHVGSENIEEATGKLLKTKSAGELNLISGKYFFTDQDVLYSKIRPYLRKVALPAFSGVCSADMYPLRPQNDSLLREFLFHTLLTENFTAKAVSFQNRTGIPKINRDQLSGILLPIPPIEEQREIALLLSASDTKINALETEIERLDELFKAMLEELMTGKLSALPLVEKVAV